MSSKKSTTSYGGDDRGPSKKEHKKIIKEIKRAKNVSEGTKYVKEKLGLVEKKAGPMDYLQKGKTTGVYASKLHGTKGGMDFYGQETKQASMDFIKNQPSSSGLYAVTSSGTMITDSSGNPILSSKGKQLLSGKSGGAMGSGDKSGIMGSIPISQPMHKSQQRIQALATGALSLFAPLGVGTVMRVAAADAWNAQGQAGYSQYLNKFYNTKSSPKSSLGVKKTGGGNESGGEVSSSGMINTSATGDNTQITKFKKKKAGQGADVAGLDRHLFKMSKQTITGKMD